MWVMDCPTVRHDGAGGSRRAGAVVVRVRLLVTSWWAGSYSLAPDLSQQRNIYHY